MNSVILIGRLAKDPDLKFTTNQKAVCKLVVAVNRMGEGADFLPVTVFGKQAENVSNYLGKGSQVGIEGRIQTGSYTNNEGRKIYTTDVLASRVEFLGVRKGKASEPKADDFPAAAPADDLPDRNEFEGYQESFESLPWNN